MADTARDAGDTARRAADSKPLELLARVGLVAYGVVHLLVGWLALQLAWGGGGESADQSGALQTLAEQPFGPALLWLVALGLVALTIWQASEAIWGFQGGDAKKRLRRRATTGAKAVVYLLLALSAARYAMGSGQSSSESQQSTTSGVLGLPFGQVLVAVVALVVIGVGVAHVRKAFTKKFMKEVDTSSMSPPTRKTITRLGQVGHVAKGVALAVVGLVLGYAAVTFDPEKARGLDGAMQTIAAQPFGQFLLTGVALGFIAFGLFAFAQSRYKPL
ncbi:MAG: DUF1206 domain-containing protein [Geodermatophilaceae bacterium]|nr:DUF1206 domain-containing protein [Geodermatophilaceae bacterium]